VVRPHERHDDLEVICLPESALDDRSRPDDVVALLGDSQTYLPIIINVAVVAKKMPQLGVAARLHQRDDHFEVAMITAAEAALYD
jgi:hypothetical protein